MGTRLSNGLHRTPLFNANPMLRHHQPKRQRGYNRLMAIFNAQQVVGLPKDQAYARLVPFFGDKRFTRHLLDHPNVERLLGWNQPVTAAAAWWLRRAWPRRPLPSQRLLVAGRPSPTCPETDGTRGARARQRRSLDGRVLVLGTVHAAETAPAATPDDFMIGASGGDVCGAVGCDRGVTDFDYRCFTCRQRFCMTHRGAGVDCPACAST